MAIPWNNWYHVTCNTYGTWLRGDQRGWRERHHRKHVDGDYKNRPAPGTGKDELKRSKELMSRDPVHLNRMLQWIALIGVVTTLLNDGIDVIVASLDDHHLHLLARFNDREPRKRMGWAKFYATKAVKRFMQTHGSAVGFQLDLKEGEGLWAKRERKSPLRIGNISLIRSVISPTTETVARWSSCIPTRIGGRGNGAGKANHVDDRGKPTALPWVFYE